MSRTSREIHDALDHPVVDGDAHWIEPVPVFCDYLATVAGPKVVDQYLEYRTRSPWYDATPEERLRDRINRPSFWNLPAETYDYATVNLPNLLRERLDEFGIDYALVYPSVGLILMAMNDDVPDLRRATCRAQNVMTAELFARHADRMTAAATIPTTTPEEAIDELDYAVGELGLKVIVVNGHTMRPGTPKNPMPYVDFYAIDSPYDYEPFWQRCSDLGVAVTAHGHAYGWSDRRSPTNFAINHVGLFINSNYGFCKAITFAGLPTRYPKLRFGFLEGGTAYAASLYSDLVGHYKLRNREALARTLRPTNLDFDTMRTLWDTYASPPMVGRFEGVVESPYPFFPLLDRDHLAARDDLYDDFAAVPSLDELRRWFSEVYFFGVEAEDPTVTFGFDGRIGARLQPLMGSDIGHFDVAVMAEVLAEAHELVDRGLLTDDDFRDLTFTNPVRLHGGVNPSFFDGTVVESAARKVLA